MLVLGFLYKKEKTCMTDQGAFNCHERPSHRLKEIMMQINLSGF